MPQLSPERARELSQQGVRARQQKFLDRTARRIISAGNVDVVEHIRSVVDAAPPLTGEQAARLAVIFKPTAA